MTRSQCGLVTFGRADQVEVSRLSLSRLLKQGHLERVRQLEEEAVVSSTIAAFTKLGTDESFSDINDSSKAMSVQFAEIQKTLTLQLDVPELGVLMKNFNEPQKQINSFGSDFLRAPDRN